MHFGYIYGFGVLGCLALYGVLNLMAPANQVSFTAVLSVLGYALLPILAIAAMAVFLRMTGVVGALLTLVAVGWSTVTATRFFEVALHAKDLRYLVAYPTFLLYACFALITVL